MSGLDLKRDLVVIDIACNDPDNGLFASRAEMISIGSDLLELEARGRAPRFLEEPADAVRLAGKTWHIAGQQYWHGNWCWNRYWFAVPEAVMFLAWLHGRRLFSAGCGEERLFCMWDATQPFNAAERDWLTRMLRDPSNFGAGPA